MPSILIFETKCRSAFTRLGPHAFSLSSLDISNHCLQGVMWIGTHLLLAETQQGLCNL